MLKLPKQILHHQARAAMNDLLKGAELIVLRKPEIPGAWIRQKCAQKDCDNQLIYWSKTSKPKPDYENAKCEKHDHG